jgi:hypothetical protein
VPVRLSDGDYAVIKASADGVNVAVAGLMRECAVRYHAVVAREIAAGNITLRRQKIEKAEAAAPVVRASSLTREDDPRWARQQELNEARARSQAAPKKGRGR